MQVFTYRSGGAWLTVKSPDDSSQPDEALSEARRSLSDCFRCNNLVVLTGLGTSLHVNVDRAAASQDNRRPPVQGKRVAPTMWDLWTCVKDVASATFDQVLTLSRFPAELHGNIEALLSYCKVAADFVDEAEGRATIIDFIQTAEAVVRDLVRFLEVDDDVALHADFLRRLARRSSRKVRAKVFTTNYDLCFEYAARHGRYVVVDGFSHTTPQVFDSLYFSYDVVKREAHTESHDFIPNVFHLYKLHGSIDWTKNVKTNEIEKDPQTEAPVLVYPRNTKYELAFEQPYLEMMSALQAALRQPDTGLLVLGFGFNDNHIAEPILSAIRSNLSLKVAICDPALGPKAGLEGEQPRPGSDESNLHLRKIRYLIEQGDARLALVSGTFEEVVPHLPDIAAETDLEQHLERVRQLRSQING